MTNLMKAFCTPNELRQQAQVAIKNLCLLIHLSLSQFITDGNFNFFLLAFFSFYSCAVLTRTTELRILSTLILFVDALEIVGIVKSDMKL